MAAMIPTLGKALHSATSCSFGNFSNLSEEKMSILSIMLRLLMVKRLLALKMTSKLLPEKTKDVWSKITMFINIPVGQRVVK